MGQVRVSWLAAVLAACAGGGAPSAPIESAAGEARRAAEAEASATRVRVASTRIGDDVALGGVAGAVDGAAAPRPEAPIPADIVALSSRMRPRPLAIPPTRPGNTNRFTFDGHRRGWLARVPGSQALLTPAYADGKVYLGGGFGSSQFYAYNARSGDPLWAASAPDGGPTAAIVEDDRVMFNTESCTLFAIHADTGEHLWRRWLGDPLMGQPASGSGMVFSGHVIDRRSPGGLGAGTTGWGVGGGRRYGFTAMRANDGRPRWTRAISADVMNGPILDGASVFFTTMDGDVYHLEQRSGRQRWRRNLGATSAPWLHGGEVHVTVRARAGDGDPAEGARERTVVLSHARGETLREHDPVEAPFLRERADTGGVRAGWAYEGSRPTVVDGRSYQTIGNEVHCRDVRTGALLWRRQYTQDSSARAASPPAVAGGQLVFGTRQGQLFALDVDTGLTAWTYEVGEPIAAQPSIAHGWVYAATTQSGLVALEVADPAFDGWHMWGGSAGHNGPTLGTTAPFEDESRPTEGTLRLAEEPNAGELGGFPIQATRVTARVTGFVARVSVTQTFENPYERPIAAEYLFPIPEGAIVSGMRLSSGGRVVRAEVRSREAAAAATAQEGQTTTTVLEQERPDLFRQHVRNVAPSERVEVTFEYTQILPFADGAYHLRYPLAAGPRHERAREGSLNAAGTPLERVLSPTDARPERVEVVVEAESGSGLAGLRSASHELAVSADGDRIARARLAGDAPPDRDLDVRIEVARDEPSAALVASPPSGREPGYLALALHPRLDAGDEVTPRELVVVLDRSSSMRGAPLELAKAVALRALAGLDPRDTFRVTALDGALPGLGDGPLAASPANVARAAAAVRRLPILPSASREGLARALASAPPADRVRVVVLATDGYLGDEREVLSELRGALGEARLYALGVGTAVNQYLLTRVVELGRGELEIPSLGAPPAEVAEAFHARIARPYLTDLSVAFEGLAVADVYPRRLPDVHADRPLVVHGRYEGGGDGRVIVRGRVAGRPFEQVLEVTLPSAGPPRPELASAWAQTRIRDSLGAMALQPSPALARDVTRLGVAHGVLTPFTTFVAVDPGDPRRVARAGAPAAEAPSSTRPERDANAYIVACYTEARDEDGAIDQDALADCLARHAPP
ncbi:MAG: PQQ-binding-like beta-propeller repeat protein [Sandaracinaceae bacterium]|nr:PQQ-binding-like beta-propeller repeat protein [Sandaracinaceae bacterium]